MEDPSVGKPEGVTHRSDIDEARRSSVASVNLNKNVDAKYVESIQRKISILTVFPGCRTP